MFDRIKKGAGNIAHAYRMARYKGAISNRWMPLVWTIYICETGLACIIAAFTLPALMHHYLTLYEGSVFRYPVTVGAAAPELVLIALPLAGLLGFVSLRFWRHTHIAWLSVLLLMHGGMITGSQTTEKTIAARIKQAHVNRAQNMAENEKHKSAGDQSNSAVLTGAAEKQITQINADSDAQVKRVRNSNTQAGQRAISNIRSRQNKQVADLRAQALTQLGTSTQKSDDPPPVDEDAIRRQVEREGQGGLMARINVSAFEYLHSPLVVFVPLLAAAFVVLHMMAKIESLGLDENAAQGYVRAEADPKQYKKKNLISTQVLDKSKLTGPLMDKQYNTRTFQPGDMPGGDQHRQ